MRSSHSLTQKLEIVKESFAPGASAAAVSRSHGISLGRLYRWRQAYRDIIATDLTGMSGNVVGIDELAALRLQVRNLERLLGQRTLEVALLRERLGLSHEHGSET